jgi:hypothetical protein
MKCDLRTSRLSASGLATSEDATSTLTFDCTPEFTTGAMRSVPRRPTTSVPCRCAPPANRRLAPNRSWDGIFRNLSRGFAPLRRLRLPSSVHPGLPHPAPSALDLSQVFDGLLLVRLARLVSCERRPWGSKSYDHFDSTPSHAPFPVARSFACYAHSPTKVRELSPNLPCCATRLPHP